MSDDLKPGTPCYLVGLVDFDELTGRVVEVVGPVLTPPNERGAWFAVRAEWTRALFQNSDIITQRCNLKPITPNGLDVERERANAACR